MELRTRQGQIQRLLSWHALSLPVELSPYHPAQTPQVQLLPISGDRGRTLAAGSREKLGSPTGAALVQGAAMGPNLTEWHCNLGVSMLIIHFAPPSQKRANKAKAEWAPWAVLLLTTASSMRRA